MCVCVWGWVGVCVCVKHSDKGIKKRNMKRGQERDRLLERQGKKDTYEGRRKKNREIKIQTEQEYE